ncbi:Phosphatidylglycerophosphatase A [Georgfuchsia toluolica]|uniref:Phosphatidylglycerophosphatase A n=1 Tax=Georgfuchsia toluolica TaxID=424218 RepID=A0A916N2X4_9PROT|nr:phosphatidylglycerophosphatase A [Georgfuchsia toluolica]CAG4884379.1 Phosphatidylglycerophosphatase A [Georgfuchsia toluolica]
MKKSIPPPLKFLFAHPAHFIACGCGSGLSPFASGTAGTLFAWITFPLFVLLLPSAAIIFEALAVLFILGIIVCNITGRHLGVVDHGAIVWDEIVPFWTVLMFVPAGFSLSALEWQLLAFLTFRFFDIIKPFPANWFDKQVKNGLGVMMDDVVAAGYTVLVLLLAQQLWGRI